MGGVTGAGRTRRTVERLFHQLKNKCDLTRPDVAASFTYAALLSALASGRQHSNEGLTMSHCEATQIFVAKAGRDGKSGLDEEGGRLIEALIGAYGPPSDLNKSRVSNTDEIRPNLSGVSALLLSQYVFLKLLKALAHGPLVRVLLSCTCV